MDYLKQYRAAFERCYPQASLDIRSSLRDGRIIHRVIINGDAGEPMSETDIRGATARFLQRGRPINARGMLCNL